jgi:opacity protein-like surface antigen
MKRLTIAALVAAQIMAVATPARGAEIASADMPRTNHAGTFVGARLRLPLDGTRRAPRATLTAAPASRSTRADGDSRLRIGEGLEFGLDGRELRFDLGGRPVSSLVQGRDAPGGPRQNVSTVAWVAIGVGVVAVGAFLLYGLCGSGEICDTEDD